MATKKDNTTTTNGTSKAARIAELIAKGHSQRVAGKIAKKERRLQNPQHKAAVARKLEATTIRFERTGNVAAFKVLEGKP